VKLIKLDKIVSKQRVLKSTDIKFRVDSSKPCCLAYCCIW